MSDQIHSARLADRYRNPDGELILRGRLGGGGPTIEILVPRDLAGEAMRIYGGGRIRYINQGGRAVFIGEPKY